MQSESAAACGVCGSLVLITAAQPEPEPLGPPDFDTRPGEPLRSTMSQWLQVCPQCGYAAEHVASAAPEAAGVVQSAEYRQLRAKDTVPARACPFLCYAFILEKLQQFADAGWSCLHAAWVCDDLGEQKAAAECRLHALSLWRRGKANGESFGDDISSEFAIVTDLYRRASLFEEATATCSEGLDLEDIHPALDAVLRRQLVLIQRRETSAHSMGELAK